MFFLPVEGARQVNSNQFVRVLETTVSGVWSRLVCARSSVFWMRSCQLPAVIQIGRRVSGGFVSCGIEGELQYRQVFIPGFMILTDELRDHGF